MLRGRFWRGLTLAGALGALSAHAENLNANYTVEIQPFLGINLPYDLWGTPGTLKTVGLRSSYNLNGLGGAGAIEGAFFLQHADPDRAYTTDLGYRYDFVQEGLNAFFAIGFHYSYFKLDPDVNADGTCVLPGVDGQCLTDTGGHSGLFLGGGIMVPLTPNVPLKFGMRFYNGPQLWLHLEMGLGIRF